MGTRPRTTDVYSFRSRVSNCIRDFICEAYSREEEANGDLLRCACHGDDELMAGEDREMVLPVSGRDADM